MAELVLKVGSVNPDPLRYQDGDILCAFNRRAIRCVHAEHICHPKAMGFNTDGLRPKGCLAQSFLESTSQYRFRRVSETTIERDNLITGTTDVFGPESIDVAQFLKRRVRHARHVIFGARGSEYWYGGVRDTSDTKLNLVWAAIESNSPHRESQYRRWPLGVQDLKSHATILVDDFDDSQAAALVSRITEDQENPNTRRIETVMLAKRAHRVELNSLGLNASQLQRTRDKNTPVDLREERSQYTRSNVVTVKPAPARIR